jgi:putative glycosyltransferase (TIGR04372 family)
VQLPRLRIALRFSQLVTSAAVLIEFFRAALANRSVFGLQMLFKILVQVNASKGTWKIKQRDLTELKKRSLSHTGDISDYENKCQEHWKFRKSRLQNSLIIGDDFTKYIGHLGFGVATRIYMQIAQSASIPKTLILYSQSSNQHLLEKYFGKYFPILQFSEPAYELLNLTDSVRFEKPAYIYTEKQALETTKVHSSFADYVYEYQTSTGQKFPGIFTLESDDIRFRHSLLRKFGFDEQQSFVVVHLKQSNLTSFRGVESKSYIPTIEYMLDNDKVVFYLGESDELPEYFSGRKNFFDITKWNDRTPRSDLVFLASCELAVVTTSGPHTIPGLFGVPTLWTNAVGLSRYLFFPQCTFLPKLFIKNDEIVSVKDMVNEPQTFFVDDIQPHRVLMQERNIKLLDNKSEDILRAFQELEFNKYFPTYSHETEILESILGRRTSVLSNRFAENYTDWLK